MASELLVKKLKEISNLARLGDLDKAYNGFRDLFVDPIFKEALPTEKRQALNLMVLLKTAPQQLSPAMIDAHRPAIEPLLDLVNSLHEPSDYELLGVCYVVTGNASRANEVFIEGLALERGRNPSSALCTSFMKRISVL